MREGTGGGGIKTKGPSDTHILISVVVVVK